MSDTLPISAPPAHLGPDAADAAASVGNSRFIEQKEAMAQSAAAKICPFCPPDPKKNVPLFDTHDQYQNWYLWLNPYPYDGHSHDFMIVSKEHRVNCCELEPYEMAELSRIFKDVVRYLKDGIEKLTGIRPAEISINWIMRSGPLEGTAGTIRHIHIQGHIADGTMAMFATLYKDKFGVMDGMVELASALGLLKKAFPGELVVYSEFVARKMSEMAREIIIPRGIAVPPWWKKKPVPDTPEEKK